MGALHVPQQVAPLSERLRAGRAGVRLLPGMHPHVAHQNVLLREAARADVALERPLPRVHAVVPDQVRLVNERRLADVAPEGPLARVQTAVPHQVVLLLEGARADVAAEAPLTRVRADVDYHVALLVRRVRTQVAVKDLLPAPVARKGRRNVGRAVVNGCVPGTAATRRASVRASVDYHVALAVGRVRAQVAEEKLLAVAVSDNGWRNLNSVGDGRVTVITAKVAVVLNGCPVFFGVQTGTACAVGFAETCVWPFVPTVAVFFQTSSLAWTSSRMRRQGCCGSNPCHYAFGARPRFLLRPRLRFAPNQSI